MKRYVEIEIRNQILRGFHHQVSGKKIVVMLHGFTGNKTESKSMFKKLSETYEKHGYDSIRVDYLGHGESDGQFCEMTLSSLISQGEEIIKYVENLGYESIILQGFSMGGLIALHLLRENIDKAILISPAVDFYMNISNKFKARLLTNGNLDMGGYELGYKFKESLKDIDLLKYADSYSNDALFIVGKNDQAVNYREVIRISKKYKKNSLHIFENCDHLYSSLVLYKKLEKIIIDFLE